MPMSHLIYHMEKKRNGTGRGTWKEGTGGHGKDTLKAWHGMWHTFGSRQQAGRTGNTQQLRHHALLISALCSLSHFSLLSPPCVAAVDPCAASWWVFPYPGLAFLEMHLLCTFPTMFLLLVLCFACPFGSSIPTIFYPGAWTGQDVR